MSNPAAIPYVIRHYEENRPLEGLRTPELFAVAAARLWVAPHRKPRQQHPDWRQGFRAAGMSDQAMRAFDALWRIVAASAHRSVDIRCSPCPALSPDEALLLQIIDTLQAGHDDAAAELLERWLPPTARRIALEPARAFAIAMADARLLFTPPSRQAEAIPLEWFRKLVRRAETVLH